MAKIFAMLAIALGLMGCRGPLVLPAFRRLDPDEQAQVQKMWDNMLVTPDRLDRELLLDTIIAFELHELGVDRATYHAEKDFAGGVVVMDIKFDRLKPLDDWFFIDIRDRGNKSLRKEHYSGDEVWSHYDQLLNARTATTQPANWPPTSAPVSTQPTEAELRAQWLELRYRQVMAATQPVQPVK